MCTYLFHLSISFIAFLVSVGMLPSLATVYVAFMSLNVYLLHLSTVLVSFLVHVELFLAYFLCHVHVILSFVYISLLLWLLSLSRWVYFLHIYILRVLISVLLYVYILHHSCTMFAFLVHVDLFPLPAYGVCCFPSPWMLFPSSIYCVDCSPCARRYASFIYLLCWLLSLSM